MYIEDYALIRQLSVMRRGENRIRGSERLTEYGISFESKNNGAHLIVENLIDYWPGTGLFIARKSKTRGRGMHNMLKTLIKEVTL